MPQVQMVDWGMDPLAEALGNVGKGFSTQMVENDTNKRKDDALARLMSEIKPGMDHQDILQKIFSAHGVPLEAKMGISQIMETANKNAVARGQAEAEQKASHKRAAALGKLLGMEEEEALDLGEENLREIYKQRNKKPTASKFDPVPPEQQERIDRVMRNPDTAKLNPEQLRSSLIDAGVAPGLADSAAKVREGSQELDYKTAENIGKRQEEKLKEYAEEARLAEKSLPNIANTILENEEYGTWDKITDVLLSELDRPSAEALRSTTAQKMESNLAIALAANAKYAGKGALTDRKIGLISKKLASPDKRKDFNRFVLYSTKYGHELALLRDKFTNEVLQNNSKYGFAPSNLDALVDEKMKPYADMMWSDLEQLSDGKMPTSPLSHNRLKDHGVGYKMRLPDGSVHVVPYDKITGAVNQFGATYAGE